MEYTDEHHAAVSKLQAISRGRATRASVARSEASAVQIQDRIRGDLERKEEFHNRPQFSTSFAATKLQSQFRGKLARQAASASSARSG